MTEVTMADAYREACTALGEAIVAQRLQARRLAELEQQPGFVDVPAPPEP